MSLVISGLPLADFRRISTLYTIFSSYSYDHATASETPASSYAAVNGFDSHHCHFFVDDLTFFSSFAQLITYYYHVNYISKMMCLLSFFKRFSLCYNIVLHSDADFLCISCIIFPVSRSNFSARFLIAIVFLYFTVGLRHQKNVSPVIMNV